MTTCLNGRHLHGSPRPFQSVSQGRSPGFWSYCSPAFPVLARAMAHQTPVAFRRTTSSQSRGRLWIRMACFILNHIPSLRHDAWHQSHLKYNCKCSHNVMIEVNQLRRRLAYLRQILNELSNRSISPLSRGKPKRIKSGHSA